MEIHVWHQVGRPSTRPRFFVSLSPNCQPGMQADSVSSQHGGLPHRSFTLIPLLCPHIWIHLWLRTQCPRHSLLLHRRDKDL